jgi:Transposase domain (DUF772)
MLRMYFVQHRFNPAEMACEEALLDSMALRRFVPIDLGCERVPDGTTLLRFRRLLEQHGLGAVLFERLAPGSPTAQHQQRSHRVPPWHTTLSDQAAR